MIVPLVGLSGCGNEHKGIGSDGAMDRYAHRFFPVQAGWIQESEIPEVSRESRKMVIWEVSEVDPDVTETPEHFYFVCLAIFGLTRPRQGTPVGCPDSVG